MRRTFSKLLSFAVCAPNSNKNGVTLKTTCGKSTELCSEWILDNDVAHKHATGQKLGGLVAMPQYWDKVPAITEAQQDGDVIRCTFEDGHKAAIRNYDVERYALCRNGFAPLKFVEHASQVRRIPFSVFKTAIEQKNKGSDYKNDLFDALVGLWEDGLVVVEGCTTESSACLDIARSVDHELRTLYGTEFKVASEAIGGQPKNNVAYTSVMLDLHQDIVYLESMPGMQLLCCERFDDDVAGGESIFLDAFLVAETLRKEDPAAFEVLTKVPAAFMKDDMDRPIPAQYYYATPHIQLNDLGDIIKVVWAPAFEAPVPPTEHTREFYKAKMAFTRILERLRPTSLVEFRMKPGDCVIFHNCRMLHGRKEFDEPAPKKRVLHGCYLDVDVFRNKTVALGRELDRELPTMSIANRSWR